MIKYKIKYNSYSKTHRFILCFLMTFIISQKPLITNSNVVKDIQKATSFPLRENRFLLPSQIEKKKASYSNGCDDYLVKPFEPSELLLRIKKLLNPRFNKNISSKIVYFGDFEFD